MADIKLADIVGLRAWTYLVANNQDSWNIPEIRTQINFFGHDDSTYLVIDTLISDQTSTQFTFIAEDEPNKPRTLILLFDFLKSIDFNLTTLLAWLENANWLDREMGDCVLTHGLAIYRDYVQAVP